MQIEKIAVQDVQQLLNLILALAEEESFPYPVTVTSQDLINNLLAEESHASAFFIKVDNQLAGFAVVYKTFATTTGKNGLHLDDFYILPEFRGKGLGEKFIRYLAINATKSDFARIEWLCVASNKNAISFYQSLGAKSLEELKFFRLDSEAINNLNN